MGALARWGTGLDFFPSRLGNCILNCGLIGARGDAMGVSVRDQIQKLLHKVPFAPFSVDVAPDIGYAIPTPGHVLAAKNVLVIEDDSGSVDVIPYGHIRRISFNQERVG